MSLWEKFGGKAKKTAGPSDLEVFRRYSPKDPPMIAQDMPDYHAFCSGYYQHCEHCPHYVNSGTGLFCSMWEAVYPGVVRWYPA